jgi:hypothetical protein
LLFGYFAIPATLVGSAIAAGGVTEWDGSRWHPGVLSLLSAGLPPQLSATVALASALLVWLMVVSRSPLEMPWFLYPFAGASLFILTFVIRTTYYLNLAFAVPAH